MIINEKQAIEKCTRVMEEYLSNLPQNNIKKKKLSQLEIDVLEYENSFKRVTLYTPEKMLNEFEIRIRFIEDFSEEFGKPASYNEKGRPQYTFEQTNAYRTLWRLPGGKGEEWRRKNQ